MCNILMGGSLIISTQITVMKSFFACKSVILLVLESALQHVNCLVTFKIIIEY